MTCYQKKEELVVVTRYLQIGHKVAEHEREPVKWSGVAKVVG